MRIRPARVGDAGGIAHVHVESWRSTYRGIIVDDFLASLSIEQRAVWWRENLSNQTPKTFIFVATDANEQVVGFASGGPQRDTQINYDAELYAIYLLETVQGRGLGRCLMQTMASQLVTNGFKTMLVWVLKDNPSRQFYETLGGKYVSEKAITVGEQDLIEVAYGWRNLLTLLESNVQ